MNLQRTDGTFVPTMAIAKFKYRGQLRCGWCRGGISFQQSGAMFTFVLSVEFAWISISLTLARQKRTSPSVRQAIEDAVTKQLRARPWFVVSLYALAGGHLENPGRNRLAAVLGHGGGSIWFVQSVQVSRPTHDAPGVKSRAPEQKP
jgi:hypothetical protein